MALRGQWVQKPINLTKAVHEEAFSVTIGAQTFYLPWRGINFLVDVEQIKYGSVYVSPTPSFILPVEYTMSLDTFKSIGGHIDAVKPIEEVLNEVKDKATS